MAVKSTLGPHETIVLGELAEAHDGYMVFFQAIVDRTNLTTAQVRRAARSLRRLGLAELAAAFDEDDGRIVGRGYYATKAGIARWRELQLAASNETTLPATGA